MQIPRHDLVEDVEADGRAERLRAVPARPIFLRQRVEGGDKKGAGTAGRIDDGEVAQRVEPVAPKGELPRPAARALAHAVLRRAGGANARRA